MRQGKQKYREISPAKTQEDAFKTNTSKTNTFEADTSQTREVQKKA